MGLTASINASASQPKSTVNLGALFGGIIGGVILIILVILIATWIYNKYIRSRKPPKTNIS